MLCGITYLNEDKRDRSWEEIKGLVDSGEYVCIGGNKYIRKHNGRYVVEIKQPAPYDWLWVDQFGDNFQSIIDYFE